MAAEREPRLVIGAVADERPSPAQLRSMYLADAESSDPDAACRARLALKLMPNMLEWMEAETAMGTSGQVGTLAFISVCAAMAANLARNVSVAGRSEEWLRSVAASIAETAIAHMRVKP